MKVCNRVETAQISLTIIKQNYETKSSNLQSPCLWKYSKKIFKIRISQRRVISCFLQGTGSTWILSDDYSPIIC